MGAPHLEQQLRGASAETGGTAWQECAFLQDSAGAIVGDILISVIETCALNQLNLFAYLVTLVQQAAAVRANPALWLP